MLFVNRDSEIKQVVSGKKTRSHSVAGDAIGRRPRRRSSAPKQPPLPHSGTTSSRFSSASTTMTSLRSVSAAEADLLSPASEQPAAQPGRRLHRLDEASHSLSTGPPPTSRGGDEGADVTPAIEALPESPKIEEYRSKPLMKCAFCKRGRVYMRYSVLGLILGVCCFPCGLLVCLRMRQPQCVDCGMDNKLPPKKPTRRRSSRSVKKFDWRHPIDSIRLRFRPAPSPSS